MRLRALWSVANDLRPFYDEKAKERQVAGLKQNQSVSTVLEKIPERKEGPTARDEKAKDRQGTRNDLINIEEKIPQANRANSTRRSWQGCRRQRQVCGHGA